MELPGPIKRLGEKISKITGNKGIIVVEQAADPKWTAALETRSKGMLVRLYTDPTQLESLGAVGRTTGGFLKAGEQLTHLESDFGINTNVVPHLTANLKAEMARSADITALTREKALSIVDADRRSVIEGEALLEAQKILTEKLKEEGVSGDYRAGASEMLKRIEAHIKKDIALTGENSR